MKIIFALWLVLLAACQIAAHVRALYRILDLSPSASNAEIKRAYKLHAKKYHPDKGGLDARFVAISQAYQTLSNAERRIAYDLQGESTMEPFTTQDARDVYNRFWGEDAYSSPMPVQAYEHDLKVTLAQIYTGVDIQITVRQNENCHHCGGSGAQFSDVCPKCMGRGLVDELQEFLTPGMKSERLQLCECGGTGTVVYQVCPVCNGDKVTRKTSPLILEVPQGAPEGYEIRKKHKDKTVGDLVFRTVEQEEPGWRRKGGNLFLIHTISLHEASFGFSSTILHINGTNFTVSREGKTKSGYTQTLEGMGMPYPPSFMRYFRWSGFGDLYITYQVTLPDKLPLVSHGQPNEL